MTLLGLLMIVVEAWWVVAIVGVVHIVASLVLGILVVCKLAAEEDEED